MIYNVYGLVSPIDGQIVYVGMTIHSIEHRLNLSDSFDED